MIHTLARRGMAGMLALTLIGAASWHSAFAQETVPAPEAAGSATPAPDAAPAEAATPGPPPPDAGLSPELQPLREEVDGWTVELDSMILAVQRPGLRDDQLTALRSRAEEIIGLANGMVMRLQPMLAASRARLDQLGPAPGEGDPPESEQIAAVRAAQTRTVADIDAILKQARLNIVQAEQVIRDVASIRRDRFATALTTRSQSVLNPQLWYDAVAASPRVLRSLRLLIVDSWSVATTRIDTLSALSVALAVIVAALLGIVLRRWLRRLAPPIGDARDVPRLNKLARVAFVVFSDVLAPTVALVVLYMALSANLLLTPRLAELFRGAIVGAALAAFLFGLARALLAPLRPGWRPIPVPDATAAQVGASVAMIGVVVGISAFLDTIHQVTVAPLPLEVARRALTSLLIAILVASALWRLTAGWQQEVPADAETSAGHGRLVWPWTRGLVWLIVVAIFVSLLFGYIALAHFLAIQLVFIVVIIALMWLLIGLTDEIVATMFVAEHRIGKALCAAFGISEQALIQLGLVVNGLARIGIILLGAMMVLLPWGFDTGQWSSWLRSAFFGFTIGDVTISLSTLLMAVVLFLIGIAATRAVQGWLSNRFLPNTRLDRGLRNSISTVVGYAGIIVAALFAASYMGLNLENVALLAGALSVGIGFGLQSIVNNFVSGLILLAERPIKEGDWIVVGSEQGNVRKISIRATEIETFDRATVIVPNSELITSTVKNWMHSSLMGRIDVDIGVGYDSDAEQVRDILLDIARSHPNVLAYPEPRVFFVDFGESALLFRLFAFVGDVNVSLSVRSDIRFAILKRLREADIEIPFPQRDLHIKGIERLMAVAGAAEPESEMNHDSGSSTGRPDRSDIPEHYRSSATSSRPRNQ